MMHVCITPYRDTTRALSGLGRTHKAHRTFPADGRTGTDKRVGWDWQHRLTRQATAPAVQLQWQPDVRRNAGRRIGDQQARAVD